MLLVVADTTGDSVKRAVILFLPLLLTDDVGELDATKEYVAAPVIDPLIVKDIVPQPLILTVFVGLCIVERVAQTVGLLEEVTDFVCMDAELDRLPDVLPLILRETKEDRVFDKDTVLVCELVDVVVEVWLVELLRDGELLIELLEDPLFADEIVTDAEPLLLSVPVSLNVIVGKADDECEGVKVIPLENVCVTLTVCVTPVGNVV